ncbi:MAG: aldehyde dehydrogenase family protein, partial [Candidatus Bipolaricaulia bacterium]
EELEVGNVWINDPLVDNMGASHRGVKMSGIGREMGIDGLEEFRHSKRLHLDYTEKEKEWWY